MLLFGIPFDCTFRWLFLTCNWQMSGSRIRVAGRFKPCVHTGCFDLETFVELNQRTRKASYSFILLFLSMFRIFKLIKVGKVSGCCSGNVPYA